MGLCSSLPAVCQLYGFVGGLCGFVSIATLAWVAYDRYVVISNPLEAAQKVTKKRAMLMILSTWIFSLVWSLPPFFGFGAYVPEGFQVRLFARSHPRILSLEDRVLQQHQAQSHFSAWTLLKMFSVVMLTDLRVTTAPPATHNTQHHPKTRSSDPSPAAIQPSRLPILVPVCILK